MFQLSVVSIHYSSPRDLYQLPAVTSKKYSVVISTDVYNTNLHIVISSREIIYTVSQKIPATFNFTITSANVDQFSYFFSLLYSKTDLRKRRN